MVSIPQLFGLPAANMYRGNRVVNATHVRVPTQPGVSRARAVIKAAIPLMQSFARRAKQKRLERHARSIANQMAEDQFRYLVDMGRPVNVARQIAGRTNHYLRAMAEARKFAEFDG
jgi:hypothetical protein